MMHVTRRLVTKSHRNHVVAPHSGSANEPYAYTTLPKIRSAVSSGCASSKYGSVIHITRLLGRSVNFSGLFLCFLAMPAPGDETTYYGPFAIMQV